VWGCIGGSGGGMKERIEVSVREESVGGGE